MEKKIALAAFAYAKAYSAYKNSTVDDNNELIDLCIRCRNELVQDLREAGLDEVSIISFADGLRKA